MAEEEIKEKWESYKAYVATLIATPEEKANALYEYAREIGVKVTDEDLRQVGAL